MGTKNGPAQTPVTAMAETMAAEAGAPRTAMAEVAGSPAPAMARTMGAEAGAPAAAMAGTTVAMTQIRPWPSQTR